MRTTFPLFQIKYTPKGNCKLHRVLKERMEAAERAAAIGSAALLDQEAALLDDDDPVDDDCL